MSKKQWLLIAIIAICAIYLTATYVFDVNFRELAETAKTQGEGLVTSLKDNVGAVIATGTAAVTGGITLISKIKSGAQSAVNTAKTETDRISAIAGSEISKLEGDNEKLQLKVTELENKLSTQNMELQQKLGEANATIQDQKKEIDEAIAARDTAMQIASMAQNQPQRECIKCHQPYLSALPQCPNCGSQPYVK